MKSNLMPSPVMVDDDILKNIVVVKETVAFGLQKQNSRSFGIVDMWNIRRNARTASNLVRRY